MEILVNLDVMMAKRNIRLLIRFGYLIMVI